ncbi:predicted protein [Histoplasma capsulatum var. duboisii H88]|uniref:Predicted protein n=2 Tax=Ajellomyces capsulatus TaxID=5037 RepID=F0UBQ4_AJEC8|nr:predicted protein [Histoplasma capsulatum H143]EGC43903.1 predicted protein [Histoplasma capsulatum var. duboisii H88]
MYVLLTALEQTQLKTVIRHLVSHSSDLRVLQRCVSKNTSVYIEYTAKKRAKSRFESVGLGGEISAARIGITRGCLAAENDMEQDPRSGKKCGLSSIASLGFVCQRYEKEENEENPASDKTLVARLQEAWI